MISTNSTASAWKQLQRSDRSTAENSPFSPLIHSFSLLSNAMHESGDKTITPLTLLEWQKSARLVIDQQDTLTSNEFSRILFICSRWKFLDLGLLHALVRWGSQPESIEQFTWVQIAHTARALGSFTEEAYLQGREDIAQLLHKEAQPFLRKLLTTFLRENELTNHSSIISPLGTVIRGIGSLFRKDQCEEISRSIDILALKLVQNYRSKVTQRPYVDLLKGFRYYDYSYRVVLDEVSLSIMKMLRMGRSFLWEIGNVLLDIGQLGVNNPDLNELLAKDFILNLDDLNPGQLVRGLRGICLLHEVKKESIKAIEDHLSKVFYPEFSKYELISCIYCIGGSDKWSPSVITRLGHEVCRPDRLKSISHIDLKTILGSLAVAQFTDKDVLETLAMKMVLEAQMAKVPAASLSKAAWAFGKLQFHHQPFMMLLKDEVTKLDNLAEFCDKDISNILMAYGKLSIADEEVVDALSTEIVKPERLQSNTEQGLANILWAFSALSYSNENCMLAIGHELCSSHRKPFECGHHAAMSFLCYGALGIFDFEVLRYWINCATKQVHLYSPRDLCDITHSLYLLASKGLGALDPEVLNFLDESSQILHSRSFSDLSTVAWMKILQSYSRLKYLDRRLLDSCLRHTHTISPEQKIDWASQIWNFCAWFDCLEEADCILEKGCRNLYVGKNLSQITQKMFIGGYTGEMSGKDFEECCRIIIELKLDGQKLSKVNSWKILESWMALTILQGYRTDNPQCASLIEEAKHICTNETEKRKSQIYDYIKFQLMYDRVPLSQKRAVFDDLIPVGILVDFNPPVVIECDGPGHYTINAVDGYPKLLAKAILKKKLLAALGYKVHYSYCRLIFPYLG